MIFVVVQRLLHQGSWIDVGPLYIERQSWDRDGMIRTEKFGPFPETVQRGDDGARIKLLEGGVNVMFFVGRNWRRVANIL